MEAFCHPNKQAGRQARRINTKKNKERRKMYSYITIWGDFDIIFHEPRSFRSSSHSHNVSLLLVICIFVFSIFLDAFNKIMSNISFIFFSFVECFKCIDAHLMHYDAYISIVRTILFLLQVSWS